MPSPRAHAWAPRFFAIWTGQQLSLIGSAVAQFALVWWLTVTTGSATVLATASLVALLPAVALGPFAGALVDRWSRRRLLIAADGLMALAAAALALLFWTGAMRPWHVYIVLFIRAIGEAFHWPTMAASTTLLVPERHLARVAGANQSVRGALRIVSPPLGALLLGLFPLHAIMALDVATALMAILPLLAIAIPQPARRSVRPDLSTTLWKEIGEGFRFLKGWPGLWALLAMAMGVNFLLNPAFSLLPLLVAKHFRGEALELGWMESAEGLGVVAGGLILSMWGGFRRKIQTCLTGLAGMGVGILALGFCPEEALPLALGAMFLTGAMDPITNGPVIALLQSVVPPEMQGRVFTVIQSVTAAISPLGLAVAGPLAQALGLRAWFVAGGAACLLMALAGFSTPSILHLEDRAKAVPSQGALEAGNR